MPLALIPILGTNTIFRQPENVLLVSHDKDSDIKLVDFGLAKMLKEGEIIRDMVGTPEFVGKLGNIDSFYFLYNSVISF